MRGKLSLHQRSGHQPIKPKKPKNNNKKTSLNRTGLYQMLRHGREHQLQVAGLQWDRSLFIYVLYCMKDGLSQQMSVSLGDHMGVHLRDGAKGSCVPASEGTHIVTVNLGVSDTEDKRGK